jgi:hypothetical protein
MTMTLTLTLSAAPTSSARATSLRTASAGSGRGRQDGTDLLRAHDRAEVIGANQVAISGPQVAKAEIWGPI